MDYPVTSRRFFEALREGRVTGVRCVGCGALHAPPVMVCGGCGGSSLAAVDLSPRGVVRTFTVIRVPPEGFEAPYVVGMVELDDGPWLVGRIEAADPAGAGMELIGRRVAVRHALLPGDRYSAGERDIVVFDLVP
ncbi:MAG: Zn-ribbon domain-containing OB-fold protein [bacterium]